MRRFSSPSGYFVLAFLAALLYFSLISILVAAQDQPLPSPVTLHVVFGRATAVDQHFHPTATRTITRTATLTLTRTPTATRTNTVPPTNTPRPCFMPTCPPGKTCAQVCWSVPYWLTITPKPAARPPPK
jgi:hypothetical protein